MLKCLIPDVVWGALFGIFVTVVGVGATIKYLPSPPEAWAINCRQPTIQTQEKSETGEKSTKEEMPAFQNTKAADLKNKSESQKDYYECLIAKYTGNLANVTQWLVAVTLLLAFFGFWQVMVSRSTARRQLRAYVTIIGGSMSFQNKTTYGILELKNSGQTPAYELSIWSQMKIHPTSNKTFVQDPRRTRPDDSAIAKMIVGPGATTNPRDKLEIPADNDVSLPAIQRGHVWVYIWGRIDYRDVFRCKRFVEFRLRSH